MIKTHHDNRRQRIADEHFSWIRMIVLHNFYGIVIGTLLAWAIMHYDINRIGTMIAGSPNRIGYTVLLTFGFASLLAMVMSGTAVWFRAVMDED